MRCEFQAGDLEMALFSGFGRPDWLDETGRCKLEAGPDQSLCPDHLAIEEEEEQRLQEFLQDGEVMPNK
jgi:hypothetical protein